MGQRHERGGLVSGVTKHDTLITSAGVLNLGGIDRLGNVGGLFLDGHDHVASAVVETLSNIIITDLLDCLADHLLVVNSSAGGDLAEDHDHASLGAGLASNTGHGVLLNTGIKDSVGHLIANLICLHPGHLYI